MKKINENKKIGQGTKQSSNSPPQFGQGQKQVQKPKQQQEVICKRNSDGSVVIIKNGKAHGFSKKQIEFFQMVVELVKTA